MKNTIKIISIGLVIFIAACTGDVGPMGAQGVPGQDGLDGADGSNGSDGVANLFVDTFRVYESSNVTVGAKWNSTGYYYEHFHTVAQVTDSVINGGAVLLYLSTSAGWQGMPWVQVISTNTEIKTYNYAYSLNQVYLAVELTDQTDPDIAWDYPDGGNLYKIVIIPPAQKLANPDLDWNDYYAVSARFGIRD